jgi:hypothetical protein
MPLPPRSSVQVTRATLRSSVAVPEMFTVLSAVLNTEARVGSTIDKDGARLSTRASASSRVAALGSGTSTWLLPPHATIKAQTAAMGVRRVLDWIRFFINYSLAQFSIWKTCLGPFGHAQGSGGALANWPAASGGFEDSSRLHCISALPEQHLGVGRRKHGAKAIGVLSGLCKASCPTVTRPRAARCRVSCALPP